jgi:hypothetical protein
MNARASAITIVTLISASALTYLGASSAPASLVSPAMVDWVIARTSTSVRACGIKIVDQTRSVLIQREASSASASKDSARMRPVARTSMNASIWVLSQSVATKTRSVSTRLVLTTVSVWTAFDSIIPPVPVRMLTNALKIHRHAMETWSV